MPVRKTGYHCLHDAVGSVIGIFNEDLGCAGLEGGLACSCEFICKEKIVYFS